jgi:hypothetical protein
VVAGISPPARGAAQDPVADRFCPADNSTGYFPDNAMLFPENSSTSKKGKMPTSPAWLITHNGFFALYN